MSLPSSLQIIYASTSGNVEFVCEEVAAKLPINSQLHRAEITDIQQILDAELLLIATSTWAHGELNPFFNELNEQMKKANLQGKFAGFIGLGDKRYEPVLFCNGIEILKSTFTEAGGAQIGSTLKVNGEPYHQLEDVIKPWIDSWWQQVINKFENNA